MMRKYILPIINIAFPYSVIAFLLLTFSIGNSFIIEGLKDIIDFDPYIIIAGILLLFFACFAFNVAYMCDMLANRHNVTEWMKQYVIIKCAQIPAYIFIFLFGVLCVITIFTIPFSFLLWVFDCLGVFLTGLLAIAGIVRAYKEKMIKKSTAIWCCIGSFVFCIDVIIAIVLYRKVKKQEFCYGGNEK